MIAARPPHRPRGLDRCFSIADLQRLARRRLPAPIYPYLEGGADDEVTLRANTLAFDAIRLAPRVLTGVAAPDLSTTILGRRVAMPVLCSPTGMTAMFHAGAEPAVARAAADAGVFYGLSTMATTRMEDVAAYADGPRLFQIYIFRDPGLTDELVDRAAASRYDALCLTVDTAVAGNRERDRITGMHLPPRFGLAGLTSFAASPAWVWGYLRGPAFGLPNVEHRADGLAGRRLSVIDYVNAQFEPAASWSDLERIRARWSGPLVVKGVQSVHDAHRAVAVGATALMLPNHGGRQLDGVAAPIELIARVRDACGDAVELIVDGGVRRGTHVLKAIAAGADACSIGRPYLYGLAAAGEAGVRHALHLLRTEIARDMTLLGVGSIPEVGPHLLHD